MIHFELLHDAYVEQGRFTIQKYYRDGFAHVQGLENIIADPNDPGLLKKFPASFQQEWATFIDRTVDVNAPTFNPELTTDPGAYGIGVPSYQKEYLTMPRIKKVTLFYMKDVAVSEARTLLQLIHSEFTPIEYTDTKGVKSTLNLEDYIELLQTVKLSSRTHYYDFISRLGGLEGYNRTGASFPPFLSESYVSELSVVKGEVEDSNGNKEVVTVHLTPMFIRNSSPLFSLMYMETQPAEWLDPATGETVNLVKKYGTSGQLYRWYGGIGGGSRAPINYDGDAIPMGSHPSGLSNPLVDQHLVIDGQTYIGADAYNVTRNFRN